MGKHLTTTETMGRGEVDQPGVGPEGVRLAGASESKDTESTELDGNAELWKERADEAREALEYIAHAGLSARHIEDYAKEFLRRKGAAK